MLVLLYYLKMQNLINYFFFAGSVFVGGVINIFQCYGRELYVRRAFILQSLIGLEKRDAEKFLLHMVPSKVAKKVIKVFYFIFLLNIQGCNLYC